MPILCPRGLGLLTAAVIVSTQFAASAADFSIIYSFEGGSQGYYPFGKPLLDQKGKIFGTTAFGGTAGAGTVFSLATSSAFLVLHSFLGAPDGLQPTSGVIQGGDGQLRGTTLGEVSGNGGTIFSVGVHGNTYRVEKLSGPVARYINSGLIMSAGGDMYGMAELGGAADLGTVYKVQPNGKTSVMHSFLGGMDGENPSGGSLAQDASGNLYGATRSGGPANHGVIFKISPTGVETLLYTFPDSQTCASPNNSLAIDSAGTIYGATLNGGVLPGSGCVFTLSPDGQFTVVHYFAGKEGGTTDGSSPSTGVVLDIAGNIYGATYAGGYDNMGVIYRISPTGEYTLMHSFTGGIDGNGNDNSELALDPRGAIIGVNGRGGTFAQGDVYRIIP